MRTKAHIAAELFCLRALKPTGPFAARTALCIQAAVEELEHGVDDTADEFNELTAAQRDIVFQTRLWKEGEIDERPSMGWGALVENKT